MKSQQHRRILGVAPAMLAFGSIGLTLLLALWGTAEATHGSTFINLASTTGLSVTHNGAIFTQGGIGAGTGNFDPFLTLSPGGNANTEQGYNTTSPGQFDEQFGGDRTHPIQAAAIPSVDIAGTRYRVILLDANDQGAEDFMSIDTVKVFLDDQNNLHQFNNATNTFGTDNSSPAALVFNMDANCPGSDCVLLMRSQTFTPGSGVSDISIALPDSIFPPECFYGSQTCNKWFYLFTQMGGYVDDGSDPVSGTQNWNVTAGFEEWRTELVPVVNVSKTAVTSVTRNFTWTVDKKVKVNGTCVDAATVDLFLDESQTAEWCITATRDAGTLTNPTLSGTITITNPTGGGVIEDPIPATITSIVDNVDFSNIPDQNNIQLSCPFTLPFTLAAGASVQCTYSVPATGANASTTGTNTVTVQVEDAGTPFVATATFDFGSPDTVNEVNETATLTDSEGPLNQPAVSGQLVTYTRTYTCDEDEGTTTNTATVTPNEGGTPASDSATLTINCHELTVTKNAQTSLTRTWNWTIDKSVGPSTWDLFTGESGTSEYTVTVTKTGFTDSNWAVAGQITVSNAGNPIPATINSVTDLVSGVGAATVDCGAVTFPHVIAAGGQLVCTYSADLPDAEGRTNTATATQQLFDYDQNGTATADGTKTYSGSANVDFSSATITEVNPSVSVTDTVQGSLGTFSDTGSTSYTRTFECDGDEGTHNNTASIVETGQSDSASVTVNCYQLAVTKNAQTSLTRTWNWTIDKSVHPSTWDLFTGESGTSEYTVTVTKTGFTDSNWAVAGQITVSNAGNPIPATINSVTDLVSGVGAATVDCGAVTFPHVIAAGGQLVCTYQSALPNGSNRTNSATATQQLHNYNQNGAASEGGTKTYSGSATVDFSSATITEVNSSVSVTDTFAGNLGAFSDTGWTSYTRKFECDEDEGTHNNTASIVETGQSDSASVTVNCYQLAVTKNAQTSFTRTYQWDILKSSDDPNGHNLTLNVNEIYANYPYSVTVDVRGFTDSDWAVAGQITVSNAGNPIPATINSVADLVSGVGAATVDCGAVTFPHVIAAGGQLVCTYSADLPDAEGRTNTATATQQLFDYDQNGTATAGGTADYSGSANVTFGDPTTIVDEQVSVSDTFAGDLGTCDVDGAPCTFAYDRDFGPFSAAQCGEHRIDNTATFVTNDTQTSGDSSWFVVITVPCPTGCTLTQGYWKTHSVHGPAPADPTWDELPNGADTEFFDTGKTWYQVFWTAPKGGNANYILAHQYMAAVLNQLAGAASTPEVDAALSGAALYFQGVTNLDQKPPRPLRDQLISWAATLAAYNEGDIGPGHCSEDSLGLANNHD